MTAPQNAISLPIGHVVITTHGHITDDTVASLLALQKRFFEVNLQAVKIQIVSGNLVDKARNDAVQQFLADKNAGWCLQLDADMVWQPTIVEQLLVTAYHEVPFADVVGAWCPLRGKPFLPTIDTGTGTWESIMPGLGPIEVIRTGGAAILAKRHVFERMEAPWYGVRAAPRALDTLTEFDNYCRVKFDGRFPFDKYPEWKQILGCAKDDAARLRSAGVDGRAGSFLSTVGEDSSFCDRARALGFRIFVQTNAVCGHVDQKTIMPQDHRQAMAEQERQENLACGVLE